MLGGLKSGIASPCQPKHHVKAGERRFLHGTSQLKELEEAALPIARLLVPHPGGPKIAPLVDRLREAPSRLATYVKHLARSIPKQVLAFMKSYFPKAPVELVAGGVAANCTDEQYTELLEQMAPIAEQVVDKLNLQ
jgi:hypothetical protein